jgi:hypothetical protein
MLIYSEDIIARQKRGAIHAAFVNWPPGLDRIIIEYAISTSELVEEYVLGRAVGIVLREKQIYLYTRTRIWDEPDFRIDIMWRGHGVRYTLDFMTKGPNGRGYNEFVNDFSRNDLIGVIKGNLAKIPYHREAMLDVIQQMIAVGMKANITETLLKSVSAARGG